MKKPSKMADKENGMFNIDKTHSLPKNVGIVLPNVCYVHFEVQYESKWGTKQHLSLYG